MRHLLVVDDEPNLVDGLCHALAEALGDEVDISKAYSGSEALAILSESPVDLVITDVRMPDISGPELMQIMHERRMGCRVLVITGYDEFDTIHKAVKLPMTAGFLLKNEGDEEVIKAVKKSLADIEASEKAQLALALAQRQGEAVDILLRERRLWNILGVLPYYDDSESSSETALVIDLNKPLLLVIVRSFSSYISADTIIWLEQQVNYFLSTHFKMEMSILGSVNMAWLLQEKDDAATKHLDDAERAKMLRACMLEIQSKLANIGTEVSVALTSKWIKASDLPGYVHALRNVLQNVSISGRHQQVIDLSTDEEYTVFLESANAYVSLDKYIHRARNALFKGDEEEWDATMKRISRLSASEPSVTAQLLNIVVTTSDALGLPPIIDMTKLLSPDGDYDRLNAAGIDICRKRKRISKHAINNIIDYVHESIEKNLGSPTLSVTSIATETHYNPSYLSRLYKQQTGVNIMETINNIRIRKSCELLKDPSLKIMDISYRIGFASPSSFTFFFRKRMGMTPKEFRIGKLNL